MKFNFRASAYSAVISMVLVVILTIIGETSRGFSSMLVSITGHHWITKGVISVAAFIVLSVVLGTFVKEKKDIKNEALLVAASSIALSAVIFIFYLVLFFSE